MHILWIGPLALAVVTALMYAEVGPSALLGSSFLLLLLTFNGTF